tara:strand:- start:3443 stop:4351 length:909 start_codon:yes stop_codon:yes gene_type:complete
MKLIMTPSVESLTLALYDTDTNETMLVPSTPDQFNTDADDSRPMHRPYGISWSEDNIFVANRKNLLIYDNQLEAVEVVRNILDENSHSLFYRDGKLACAMVRKECVAFYDVVTGEIEMYHPQHGWGDDFPITDSGNYTFRLNALGEKDGIIYYLLFNKITGDKELHGINTETRQPITPLVFQCNSMHSHGIMIRRGKYLTLNQAGLLEGLEDPILQVPLPVGYKARGMAGDEITWACAYHLFDYTGTGSYVNVYDFSQGVDTTTEPSKVRYVEGVGSINDMRRIDGVDFCHRNQHDFPYTGF